jgi:hypothetical protein
MGGDGLALDVSRRKPSCAHPKIPDSAGLLFCAGPRYCVGCTHQVTSLLPLHRQHVLWLSTVLDQFCDQLQAFVFRHSDYFGRVRGNEQGLKITGAQYSKLTRRLRCSTRTSPPSGAI